MLIIFYLITLGILITKKKKIINNNTVFLVMIKVLICFLKLYLTASGIIMQILKVGHFVNDLSYLLWTGLALIINISYCYIQSRVTRLELTVRHTRAEPKGRKVSHKKKNPTSKNLADKAEMRPLVEVDHLHFSAIWCQDAWRVR